MARCYGITREEQDAFAYESQQRTKRALDEDRFKDELIPVEIATRSGTTVVARDEHPRPETTLETLRGMRPAFVKEGGTVTAGKSTS